MVNNMHNADNILHEVMIADLQKLVSIPSVSGAPEGDYPYGKPCFDALSCALDMCKAYGFRTKQCGMHCGYAEIGQGEDIFGILVHLDVVPAGNSWNFDPFAVTISDEKLYGRGVIDDKGPTVAVIHAMRALADQPLTKRVRLIFGTSEETGDGGDIAYYRNTEQLPGMGFTPDAEFPVVYLEKPMAKVQLSMPLGASGLDSACGGVAANMVADACTLTCVHDGQRFTVHGTGKSAHGSLPWMGKNAIADAMAQACQLGKTHGFATPFATFYDACIGDTTDGSRLGCNFSDAESGKTSVNVGLIEQIGEEIVITLDIRCALCCDAKTLLEAITARVTPFGIHAKLTHWADAVHMDKTSAFIQTLMDVHQQATGDTTQPLVIGGGTYARQMPNIVAFGPMFTGRECTEHQPNEYMLVEDFMRIQEIYREAIWRMCSKRES